MKKSILISMLLLSLVLSNKTFSQKKTNSYSKTSLEVVVSPKFHGGSDVYLYSWDVISESWQFISNLKTDRKDDNVFFDIVKKGKYKLSIEQRKRPHYFKVEKELDIDLSKLSLKINLELKKIDDY